jgi:hypothetical protein
MKPQSRSKFNINQENAKLRFMLTSVEIALDAVMSKYGLSNDDVIAILKDKQAKPVEPATEVTAQ